MDSNILDADTASIGAARRSSAALLARLHHHHDARMFTPQGWKKPVKPAPTPEFKELWFDMLPVETEACEPLAPKYPLIADIQRAVASHFGVTVDDIISDRRTKNVILPRHVGMFLARMLTLRSHPYIANRFGNRDHTVAIYAFRKIESLLTIDPVLAARVASIRAELCQS